MLLSVFVCVGTANPTNILNNEKNIGDVLSKQRRSTKTSFHSSSFYIGWMGILLEKLLYLGSNCHLLVASPNAFYIGECLFCLDVHLHLNSVSNSVEHYCLFQRPKSWQSISLQCPGTDHSSVVWSLLLKLCTMKMHLLETKCFKHRWKQTTNW